MTDVHEDSAPQDPVLAELGEAFPDAEFATSEGQDVFTVPREQLAEFAVAARDAGFDMCVDVTAVDYLERVPRFEVVVNLVSLPRKRRLRLRVGVPGDDPVVPSLTDTYPGTNFYEREVYDLLGVRFDGHPDLTRILLPDDWEGHPLRKDTSVGAVPVQFKSSNEAL